MAPTGLSWQFSYSNLASASNGYASAWADNWRSGHLPTLESPVPQPDEMIRQCMEAWTHEHQEYASQLGESLDALQSYEAQLHQWQEELSVKEEQLTEQDREIEERREQLAKPHASDVAITAELDQARAEVEDLRRRLAESVDPVVAASVAATDEALQSSSPGKSKSGVGLLDPSVSAVAKQFQKLRQQQAARRSSAR